MRRNEYKRAFNRWEYIESCQKKSGKKIARRITRRHLNILCAKTAQA